ncbi:hypothetical protein KCP77_05640 [Salmonella enterica subsp. enterica]|nr:hypothetical protein KCP77_05640 [Salmonella enterica subsp. enterica]
MLPRKLIEEKLYNWDDDASSNAVKSIPSFTPQARREFIRTVHGIGWPPLGDA